jgi:hypothetical protein
VVHCRLIPLALVLSSFGFSAQALNRVGTPAGQSRACIAFYLSTGHQSIERLVTKIQSLGVKLNSKSDWLAFPKSEPLTQALVEQLIGLPQTTREQLRGRVNQLFSMRSEYRQVILLALYDPATWMEFLNRAMKGPLLDDSMVNSLIPVIRAMPQDLTADVLAKVTADYSKLSKVNFTVFPMRTNLRLAPKRSIDALILHIIKPDEWFRHDLEITQNPLETYERYLQFLRTDIFKNSDRGNYKTAEIITVAEAIQNVLQKKAPNLDGASVTVTGSFPNGRAKIADSDLDARLSHQELHAYIDDMSASVNQAMKVYPVPSKFTVEAMWATTTAHFSAQINPLFLRITPTEIQIEVYPAVRPLHKDSILMDYNYEAPTRYTLKTMATNVIKIGSRMTPQPRDMNWLTTQIENHLSDFSLVVKPSKKPTESPSANELIQAVQALSLVEQSEILLKVNSKSHSLSANREAQTLLKLALIHKPAWIAFIKDAIKNPQTNDLLFNALVPVFKKLPINSKIEIQKEISAAYPEASTKAWTKEGLFFKKNSAMLSPRDAMDIIANQVFLAKTEIQNAIAKGDSATTAYGKFLSEQHTRFYPGTKIGGYQAGFVQQIATKIQSVIISNPSLFGETPIYIVGRFPNGRVDETDFGIELVTADPLNKAIEHEISYAINGRTKPEAKEFIEVEAKPLGTTLVKEAIINPIQVKITRDTVELQIHDPVQNIDRDQFQLPQNYPAPTLLKLPSVKEMKTVQIEKEAS